MDEKMINDICKMITGEVESEVESGYKNEKCKICKLDCQGIYVEYAPYHDITRCVLTDEEIESYYLGD